MTEIFNISSISNRPTNRRATKHSHQSQYNKCSADELVLSSLSCDLQFCEESFIALTLISQSILFSLFECSSHDNYNIDP